MRRTILSRVLFLVVFVTALFVMDRVRAMPLVSNLRIFSYSGPATASQNTNQAYTLQVGNDGPDNTNSTITWKSENGFTFTSISKPASWSCSTPSVGVAGDVTCTNTTFTKTTSWNASEVVALNEFRFPTTPNGHWYKCTTAGTTSSSEPSWNTGGGSTTNDGSAVWTEQGTDTFTLTLKIPNGTAIWTWMETNVTITHNPTASSPPDPNCEDDRAQASTRVSG